MLRFAYNTLGCANHSLWDALDLIASAGYQGVALTLDVHHMNPFADDFDAALERLGKEFAAADLTVVVDTGARFLLDPRERYEPTLLNPSEEGRARRIAFVKKAIGVCKALNGEAVTFTAGRIRRNVSQANAGAWLLDGLTQIAEAGAEADVKVALEPAAGHMVATLDDFALVRDATKQMTAAPLHLSLDLANTFTTGNRAPHQAVKEFGAILAAVSIADAAGTTPTHLPLGSGAMDVPAALGALQAIDYEGLITVRLPNDSHRADEVVPTSIDWLLENLPSD